MDRRQLLIIPPLFDGTNYAYQKVRMGAFLQSLDEKVWQAMEIGWTKPIEAPANQDDAKIKAENFNNKALNALFGVVTNKEVQELIEQEPASPSTPGTLSVLEDSIDIPTSPDSESYEEKGPSSRVKLNHRPEVIVGNMNELTLRKQTVDKCVANFVSYSCYLSQVEPTKVEEALQDESWV